MKLLLDEMWSAEGAVQLRRRGHDVVAVTELPELRAMADAMLFERAQREGRVIVTENASDFRRLAAHALTEGRSHAGLLLTSNRRFPRRDPRTLGRLVTALDTVLSSEQDLTGSEHWLL